MKRIAPIVLAGLLAVSAAASGEDVEARIDRVVNGLLPATSFRGQYGKPARLADRMAHFHTPGVSIAVVKDYRIDWARGFGVREAGGADPITTETVFEAGSVSKPIFALVVMKLVEEGKLDLDRDVNDYLDSWKLASSHQFDPAVSLRQLLSHSAGLTVANFPGYSRSEPIPTLPQILSGESPANTAKVEVNILPGVQFRYSGGGTTIAQLLLSDQIGRRLPDLAREMIFDPLGLRDSTYEQPLPERWHHRASTAHPWKGVPVAGKWHVYPEMAAAGLWTTPSDLARIGIDLQLALRGDSAKILPKERVSEMLTPQVLEETGPERIAIGFFLQGEGDSWRFGHGGWDEGFVTQATFDKNHGLGMVVMVNSNEGFPILKEVERAVAREYGWPDYFEEEKKAISLPASELAALAGEYVSKAGSRFTVSAKGSAVFFAVSGQVPVEIAPSSGTEFFSRDLDLTVTFTRAEKATSLVLKQAGLEVTAEKR